MQTLGTIITNDQPNTTIVYGQKIINKQGTNIIATNNLANYTWYFDIISFDDHKEQFPLQ